MKEYRKLLLTTVLALIALGLMAATPKTDPDPALKSVYQNPEIREAVEFIKNELPELIKTNPDQAAAKYEQYFNSLNKLDEMDVLYLVGHFYAVSNDALSALKYLQLLKILMAAL